VVLCVGSVLGRVVIGDELATHALLDDVVGIGEGRWPVESRPKGLSHQGGGSCMVPADA
jgi:hypothetical protein